MARFDCSELRIGVTIGMGEFGCVAEVSGIKLCETKLCDCECPPPPLIKQSPSSSSSPQRESMHRLTKSCLDLPLLSEVSEGGSTFGCDCKEEDLKHRAELRNRIADSSVTSSQDQTTQYNYAVKQIRKDLYPVKRVEAAKSLAKEQKFLSSLSHPNIVRLRGVAGKAGFDSHMLIFDKLEQSLLQQIVDWKNDLQSSTFSFPWKSKQSQLEKEIMAARLLALYDISQAVKFLHSKS